MLGKMISEKQLYRTQASKQARESRTLGPISHPVAFLKPRIPHVLYEYFSPSQFPFLAGIIIT